MNAETIKEWLKAHGKDRKWLSQKTGYSLGTVNNWLSAGKPMPEPAKKLIEILMHGAPIVTSDDPFHVTFTAAEFEEIEEARQLVNMTREEFYHEGVKELIAKVLDEQNPFVGSSIYHLPEIQAAKAAEEPVVTKKPLVLDAGAPVKPTDSSSGTESTETTQN